MNTNAKIKQAVIELKETFVKMKTTLKKWFDKVWNFCKKNWYLLAAGIVFLVGVCFLGSSDSSKKLFQDLMGRYNRLAKRKDEDLEAADSIRQEQIEDAKRIDDDYKKVIAEIRAERKEKLEDITQEQEEEIKKLIEENDGDPDKMAEQINDYFGIKVKK